MSPLGHADRHEVALDVSDTLLSGPFEDEDEEQ
jgi:hypothetical protein